MPLVESLGNLHILSPPGREIWISYNKVIGCVTSGCAVYDPTRYSRTSSRHRTRFMRAHPNAVPDAEALHLLTREYQYHD